MRTGSTQATLSSFDLVPDYPLQTDPPLYLHYNDVPVTTQSLLIVPPLTTPIQPDPDPYHPPGDQSTIGRFCDDLCPVCNRVEQNVAEHLLVDHADAVNARIDAILADRTIDPTPDPTPLSFDADTTTDTTEPEPVTPRRESDSAGESLDDYIDPRACNDCGTVMSASYARIFASEAGDLWCPDCRSRAERYSNDATERHGTDPRTVTGSSNPNSSANPSRLSSPSRDE